MLYQQALRYRRGAVEIFKIGLGDHLVEVLQSLFVLDQQDHVVGLGHVRAAQGVVHCLDIVERPRALLAQHGQELVHHARDDHCVV